MDLDKITLISMLQEKMKYQAARQEVISQNIANVDTPDYTRKDIAKPNFGEMVKSNMVSLSVTNPSHIGGTNSASNYTGISSGNEVELDMEALELMKNSNEFAKASSTYKKILSLFRLAIDGSGR